MAGAENGAAPDEDDDNDNHAPREELSGMSRDLSRAGEVVDKAVEHLIGRNIGGLAIASALLGGALGLMARAMSEEAIVAVLNNAIASVRSGQFHHTDS